MVEWERGLVLVEHEPADEYELLMQTTRLTRPAGVEVFWMSTGVAAQDKRTLLGVYA